MKTKVFSVTASMIAALVFVAFIAVNIDTNTSPDDFTAVTAPVIEIGYGWPFVCISGSIETERHFYATGFVAMWTSTINPRIAWFGFAANFTLAILLVACAYYSAHSAQARLKLKPSISTLIGVTSFAAFMVLARVQSWNEYSDIDPKIPFRVLAGDLYRYAEQIVWVAIFATCLTLPKLIALGVKIVRTKPRNQEMHRSSVGQSVLHKQSTDGTR